MNYWNSIRNCTGRTSRPRCITLRNPRTTRWCLVKTLETSEPQIKVKLDEDLSPLIAADYEVATVVSQGWSGFSDRELWPRVIAEEAFFITADSGFGDVRAYPPGTHSGILVPRASRESLLSLRDLVADLVQRSSLESLKGAVTVAKLGNIRTRRRPAPDSGAG